MSFWSLSDGSTPETTNTMDMGGGDFKVIPDNTSVTAIIEDAKWDEYEGDRFIKLTWQIIAGEYKGQKIFHKVKVEDTDPKKRDRQIKMLIAIDANAGGKLAQLGREPTDDDLVMHLSNKPMAIVLMIWDMNGKTGNWVSKVGPVSGKAAPAQTPAQTAPAPKTKAPSEDDFDDDIPF